MSDQQGPAGYPISVKGVVVRGGRVLLLKNERDEWELPGGRLEAAETPDPVLSAEHQQIGEFTETQVPDLVMPQGYKDSVAAWFAILRANGGAGMTRMDLLRVPCPVSGKLAALLGYDKTYISMIEKGRRAVHHVATRRHVARTLAIPPHLLGPDRRTSPGLPGADSVRVAAARQRAA